jgi:hypothetical protein
MKVKPSEIYSTWSDRDVGLMLAYYQVKAKAQEEAARG